ncbi:N-acetylmuramoyl-L-alanine amidase [Luteimonas pelagia]
MALVAFGCVLGTVNANEIKALRVDSGATGTRAELLLESPADYRLISLAGPDRLVVDLPGVELPKHLPLPGGSGVVRGVRSGHPEPGVTRIVFDLGGAVAATPPRIEPGVDGARLVLEWPGDGGATTPVRADVAGARPADAPIENAADAEARLAAAILAGRPAQTRAQVAAAGAAATSRLIASQQDARAADVPALPRTVPPASTATTAIADATETARVAAPTAAPAERRLQDLRGPMRPLVIAIDAGHGGQDPGAIGQSGSREKDVTLAISRELARQVNATPGLKAYLVRDTDVFIPLYERAKLARRAGADMFISIHADAAENRSADGSSVYVLSLKGASSQRARWLADKENAADLIGGARVAGGDNMLASVLLDLTQSGNMKASEDAAAEVLSGLQRVGNIHKRNVERANFAVLRTADMPSMLVETAFISNAEEEKRLRDPAFQRTIASAVLRGVTGYFSRQPPPGTVFAARAAAGGSATTSGGSR